MNFELKQAVKRRKIVESAPLVEQSIFSDGADNHQKLIRSEPLVIPLPASLPVGEESLDDIAAKELLNELLPKDAQEQSSIAISQQVISQPNSDKRKQPLLRANLDPKLIGEMDDDQRFKIDISLRADDVNFRADTFKTVPIEEFGAAMLRGMGWTELSEEDKEIARKLDGVHMRDGKLGLGAVPKPPGFDDKKGRKNETNKNVQDWTKKASEKVKRQHLDVGNLIWIRDPTHALQRAEIAAIKGVAGMDKIRVRLERGGKLVEIKKVDAVLLTEAELESEPYVAYLNEDEKLVPPNSNLQRALMLDQRTDVQWINDKYRDSEYSEKEAHRKGRDVKELDRNSSQLDRGRSRSNERRVETTKGDHADRYSGHNSSSSRREAEQKPSREDDHHHSRHQDSGRSISKRVERDSYDDRDCRSDAAGKRSNDKDRHQGGDKDRDTRSKEDVGRDRHNGKYRDEKSVKERDATHNVVQKTNNIENWLMSGIRVRVISSKLAGDRFNFTKGWVVDVQAAGVACVRLDDGKVIQEAKQKYLETVLPKCGELCLVVRGKNKGQSATLLDRNKETEIATVQLTEELDVVEVSMDDIAAYTRAHD